MITLTVTKREETKKGIKDFAKEGKMPAIVYGSKYGTQAITLSLSEFNKLLRHDGESSVIDIVGLEKGLQVLIHEIDRDPVTQGPRHADFYVVEKGAKIQVAVELSFVGESFGVKSGGSLVKVMHELEIEAGAADLPHTIEVDITTLAAVGDQIHVKDIILPKGVTTHVSADEVVALIQEVSQEVEVPAVDMESIEVEKKGKTEEVSGE
jgi:large subunit ribosomal protein L25